MRIRYVLAGAVLALGIFAGPAAAQEGEEEHNFADHDAEECFEILEGGGKVDECQEAPSPIMPATNELIWGIISFTILGVLLWKLALPGIKKGMEGRTERISKDIAAAENAKQEASTVLDEYRAQLADARAESARIIEEARQQADALKRDQEQRLQTELAEMRARSASDIEAAKNQAIADLHAQVADIAIGAAEMIVRHNLDRDTHIQLIEDYINQVAAR